MYDKDKIDNVIGVKNLKNKIKFENFPSLEAQIASISDDIAYNNHDIQDGIGAKLFNLNDLLEINFFKNIFKFYPKNKKKLNKEIVIYQIVRDSINLMVKDLIYNTVKNINNSKIKKLNDVYTADENLVCFSDNFNDVIEEIRSFLRINMYNNTNVLKKNENGKKIIKKLFNKIAKNPRKFLNKEQLKFDKHRAIADFISGMTDRYAINLYKKI